MAWDSVPAIHTAGGLLCMWNNSAFEVERKVKGTNFLMLAGKWIKEDMKMSIVNVYAPCDNAGKRELWNCVILTFISFYFLRSTKAGLLLLHTLHRRGNQTYVVLPYA